MKISELMQLAARGKVSGEGSFMELMLCCRANIWLAEADLARGVDPSDLWRDPATGNPSGFMVRISRVMLATAAACRAVGIPLARQLGDQEVDVLGGETFLRGRGPLDWLDALETAVLELRSAYLHRRDVGRAAVEAASVLRAAGATWNRVADRLVPESVGRLMETADLFSWNLDPVILWSIVEPDVGKEG
jgi:hypothetical protein